MAGSYVGRALKGASMLALSDFASRGQQQRRAIRLDGWPTQRIRLLGGEPTGRQIEAISLGGRRIAS